MTAVSGRLSWRRILLIAGVAAAAYLPTVDTYFVSDDFDLLHWASGARVVDAIARPLWWGWFRPLPDVLWRLTYGWFGLWPIGHHLVDIALHAVNAALVAQVVATVDKDESTGVLSGLLFAVSPVGVAVVPWLAGRYDLVATLFALAAILCALRHATTRGRLWLVASLLSATAALCSKESAVALPLVLGVMSVAPLLMASGLRNAVVSKWTAGAIGGLTALYLGGRLWVYGGFGGYGAHGAFEIKHALNPILALPVAVIPWQIETPFAGPYAFVWILLSLALVAVFVRLAPLWLACYVAAMAPVLNLFGSGGFVLAEIERLLYFPAVFLAAASAVAIRKLIGARLSQRGALALAGFILAAGFAGVVYYQQPWRAAGRMTARVDRILRTHRDEVPAGAVIHCDLLPDHVGGAWVYRTGCNSHVRLIWPDRLVRGTRPGDALWSERATATAEYKISPSMGLLRVR